MSQQSWRRGRIDPQQPRKAVTRKRSKSKAAVKRVRVVRTVFRARDPDTGHWNAVKRYSRHGAARHEMRVMQALPLHPHIVQYRRYYVRKGAGYIVMEWVPGMPLERFARRRRLKPETVSQIALDVLEGLAALHREGYVHGDLHPGNVIVSDASSLKVKIIDFQHAVKKSEDGRAKALRKLRHPPWKLAPESRTGRLSDRTDIYGVGYVCAVMLTGRSPSPTWIRKKAKKTSGGIWRTIAKAIRHRPSQRFASAQEMMEALRASISMHP